MICNTYHNIQIQYNTIQYKYNTIIMDSLGDRMKALEAEFERYVEPYNPFIIRLDGKNFSKFTKGFKKPFDILFARAMVSTMNDLVQKYNAVTGYTHSDEITLIFRPACTKEEHDSDEDSSSHPHNGRVIKTCTIVSGYCSVRFVHHLQKIMLEHEDEYDDGFVRKIEEAEYCFDARPLEFSHDNPGEVGNHMIWRSVHDCQRNAISTYAHHRFGHKKMQGMNGGQMIKFLAEDGLDWDSDVPLFWKHGVYAKKELYLLKTIDYKGNEVECTRSRIINKVFKIEYSEKMVELLLEKYWSGTDELERIVKTEEFD
jgi:tRNA(His) guanylyltransferase